ncbi:MAG TPA: hypothetical protein VLA04_04395 [Verrucomicrobiae bacterium]|nr:hypothetical protein [Verrucomicrobiae bacterium]
MENNQNDKFSFVIKLGCLFEVVATLLLLGGCLSFITALFTFFLPIGSLAIKMAVLGIGGGVLLHKLHYTLYRVPRYTESDLLLVLNTEWKSTGAIWQELCRLKGVSESLFDRIFRTPSPVWLGGTLAELVKEGVIEHRKVPREKAGQGLSDFFFEYRLTGTGLRRKDRVIEDRSTKEGFGVPVSQGF